jgi:putative ABC transport system permease protein
MLPARNLARHRMRSILTALGIAIAVGGMIALVGLSQGLERSWVLWLKDKGTHILALQKGSIDLLTASLDEKLAARIAAQPGVANVMGGLGELVELETGQMAYLAGRPLEGDYWSTLNMVAGSAPTAADPEGVVLGEALAQQLSKRPGDVIQLSGRDFRITGISKQASVLDDRSVMMVMPVMQHLLGREGKVSGFHIRVLRPENAAELARIQSQLAAAFPEMMFTEASEFGKNTQVTRMMRAMAWSSSTIALGMAFVAVMNTLLMSVMERTREIGLLSAIGWHSGRVVSIVVLDGVILSAAGAAGGIGLGLASLHWISVHPKLGGLFQPEVTSSVILEGAGMALLIGLLGGLYPAWRATRLNPMDLLRSE